jgi:hypothetical protein
MLIRKLPVCGVVELRYSDLFVHLSLYIQLKEETNLIKAVQSEMMLSTPD